MNINNIQFFHRDVVKDGFKNEFYDKCDAIFLDLPSPQSVI